MFQLVLIALLSLLSECSGYTCSKYRYSFYSSNYYYFYCSNGCCGTSYTRYCCSGYISYYSNTGSIAGGIIGGISLFIGLVFLCICCAKHKVHRGRVITTTTGPSMTTHVSSTVTSGQAQPTMAFNNHPGQQVNPPAYMQYPQPPPPYSTPNTMYPPPPPPNYAGPSPAYPPPPQPQYAEPSPAFPPQSTASPFQPTPQKY